MLSSHCSNNFWELFWLKSNKTCNPHDKKNFHEYLTITYLPLGSLNTSLMTKHTICDWNCEKVFSHIKYDPIFEIQIFVTFVPLSEIFYQYNDVIWVHFDNKGNLFDISSNKLWHFIWQHFKCVERYLFANPVTYVPYSNKVIHSSNWFES